MAINSTDWDKTTINSTGFSDGSIALNNNVVTLNSETYTLSGYLINSTGQLVYKSTDWDK